MHGKCTHIDNALDCMASVVSCYFKWLGLSSQLAVYIHACTQQR